MLTCIIIILVIIIIIIIAGACFYGYNSQQNYVYYDGVRYYRGKNGFFNKNKKGKFTNMPIISNVQNVPPPLQSENFIKKSILDHNIDKLQGTKNINTNLLSGDNLDIQLQNCSGYGEDAVCEDFYNYIGNRESDYKNYINKDQKNNSINAKINSAAQELYMSNRNNSTEYRDPNFGSSMMIESAPPSDYSNYLDNLMIDDRTLQNHLKWANEMAPWAGTPNTIDNLDEAMANSTPWVGLRRPQAIAQSSDALFITELGAKDLINNPKFRFNQ